MAVDLTESFFAQIAGWEAMKAARALLAADKVLSSNWTPPLLKGVVQEGSTSYRSGLVIKSERDIENVCTCRQSREWGTICAHSVAVGLRHLKQSAVAVAPPKSEPGKPAAVSIPARPGNSSKRIERAESGAGEAAEIHVILPPNLTQAVERGRVMLCFEGQWRGGRSPLNALPRGKAFAFTTQDNALLDRIELVAGGDTPAMMMIGTRDFAELLPLLADHPRITMGKSTAVTVTKAPWPAGGSRGAPRGRIKASLEANGEIVVALKAMAAPPVLVEKTWVLSGHTLQPAGVLQSLGDILRGSIRIQREQVPLFLNRDWAQMQAAGGDCVEADFSLEQFTLEPQPPRFLLHLCGGLARLEAHLQCAYGARIMPVGPGTSAEVLWLPDPEVPTRYTTRDTSAERGALARLMRAGFTGPNQHDRWLLQDQDRVLNFLACEFPRLQREWQVTLEERLERSTRQNVERIEPRFEISSSGMQWFDLSVSYEASGGERLPAAEIQRLLLSGRGYTRLRNGRLAILDTESVEELQQVLQDCSPQQREGRFRMAQTQSGFVEATLRDRGWKAEAPQAWKERAMQQSGETQLTCPPLGALETVLRPYQKDGVAWLWFLRAHGFAGILADEMGLGKTLEVLAALRAFRGSNPGPAPERRPNLVICPTSLVFNWMAEAQKFVPDLRALALHGSDRRVRFAEIPQNDLVITSYALVRRDLERYRDFEFDTVVLDEAQHIKNRQTQNAQAVKAIRSAHRLVLTGTPMENSVLDLWSIFDFLMPGYLGSAKDFRERYEVPITREKNSGAQARLARRLRPFMLRRLKRDVAKELPPKLDQVAYCELAEDQRAVYQQIMEAGRSEVLTADPNSGQSRMVALNALLRLRQACCDLRLLKLAAPQTAASSGKFDMFTELLQEVLDGGHRVLVFSQFVSMLALLREYLTAEGIEFCYLDGSTTNRGEVVARFQQSQVPVFLISLKAGGVGLNLSGADTVIHFDPWWNPAVEDQATDRAHRIGQTRLVTSYKLITRGTVEEKILQLQNRKREIIAATMGGEEQFVEALTWEEIRELFAA